MVNRPEIDGLRCIAVLPVILFHAGFSLFSGGYVGVDVFFVISGFLITTIIMEEVQVEKFSLVRFYERRARRILPALFFIILVSLPFAWVLLSPRDLHDFAQSIVAIVLFGSNILFWKESGYFETAAELKPMLHTWSLAVEEQYYVLFPLLIMAAWRFGPKRLLGVIVAIAVSSLILSEVQVRTEPATAFFLLPARAWELLLGAMGAFVVLYWRRYPGFIGDHRLVSEGLGFLGLLMILWAIFRFDEHVVFPGLTALIPTVGTLLILLFSSPRTLVGRLLGFAPLVGIGLISYSAYLWHQPLFAFTRHALSGEIPTWLMWGLSLLTLVLAYLSWRFIETPFRSRIFITRSTVFATSAAGIAALLALGLIGHFQREAITDFRLSGAPAEARSSFRHPDELFAERNQLFNTFSEVGRTNFSDASDTTKVLILGDSVSADLYGSIMLNADRLGDMEIRRMQLDDLCMPAFAGVLKDGQIQQGTTRSCRQSIQRVHDSSLLKEADLIVLSAHWRQRTTERPHLGAMALAETLAAQGREVYMVGLLAMKDAASIDFIVITRGLTIKQANEYAYTTLRRGYITEPNEDVRALAERVPKIHYIDKFALFCDDQERACALYGDDGHLLFGDDVHVSAAGAAYFGKRLADQGWLKGTIRPAQ